MKPKRRPGTRKSTSIRKNAAVKTVLLQWDGTLVGPKDGGARGGAKPGAQAPQNARPLERQLKALLFDLDGTLADPKAGITRCIVHALKKMGVTAPPSEELTFAIGPPLRPALARSPSATDPPSCLDWPRFDDLGCAAPGKSRLGRKSRGDVTQIRSVA